MLEEQVEGITLQAIPFREKERIITVFSKEQGILSMIVKNLSAKKPIFLALSNPLCLGEFIFQKKSSMHVLKDGTLTSDFSFLRKDFSKLKAASLIAKAILSTQFSNKSAHSLYRLVLSYLQKLKDFSQPEVLLYSFYLKLLHLEGQLQLKNKCTVCDSLTTHLAGGESLCTDHAPYYAEKASREELQVLAVLTYSKSFYALEAIELTESMKQIIDHIFIELHR